MKNKQTWCPQCGYGADVHDDGCCAMCGATAVGPRADDAIAALKASYSYRRGRDDAAEEILRAWPPGVRALEEPGPGDAVDAAIRCVTRSMRDVRDALAHAAGGYQRGRASLLDSEWDGAGAGVLWALPNSARKPALDDDEAIAHAMSFGAGMVFRPPAVTVVDARWTDPDEWMPTAEWVVERAEEAMRRDAGCALRTRGISVGDPALAELDNLLAAWARRHIGRIRAEPAGVERDVALGWDDDGEDG